MIQKLATRMKPVLDYPLIRRTRRNHGLEHATVHVLSGRIQNLRIAGRSTHNGFVLIGDVSTEAVEQAVKEALARMRAGEHSLATHPNCGTNLVTTGVLTALVGLVGVAVNRKQSLWNRFSWLVMWMMAAQVISQPLGMDVQRHFTTEGNPGELEVYGVTRYDVRLPWLQRAFTVHHVATRKG